MLKYPKEQICLKFVVVVVVVSGDFVNALVKNVFKFKLGQTLL